MPTACGYDPTHLTVRQSARPLFIDTSPTMLDMLDKQVGRVEMIALLALKSLTLFDKVLILSFPAHFLLEVSASSFRLVDRV